MHTALENNKQIIDKLQREFYIRSQQIIEQYYLLPLPHDNHGHDLPAKNKQNLQDGYLERPIHGAMHVGRVQFWVHILNEKIKKMLPAYTTAVFHTLQEQLGLSEKQIITLVRYAALFHDSARKHEAADKWDQESADNYYEFLKDQGLSSDIAEIFAKATAYKDNTKNYTAFLNAKGINDPDVISGFQYIRKLIHLADLLDIMRCVAIFKFDKVLEAFNDITDFNQEEHVPRLIEMAKQVYGIIDTQGDMLFNCYIVSGNNLIKQPQDRQKRTYNTHTKTAIEHAENVCSVLGESIKAEPCFADTLTEENFINTATATLEPAFNPYIHGTNSSIFAFLKRTQLHVMPPLIMIERYGMAPMSGEISSLFGGGLDVLVQQDRICFGKANSEGRYEYGLTKVLDTYAKSYSSSASDVANYAVYSLQNSQAHALADAYENINVILIYFARAKQMGIESDLAPKIIKELNAIIQSHYLLLCLTKHIHPNIALYSTDSKSTSSLYDAFIYYFTLEKIAEKIISSNINIEEIYNNPTPENLEKILSLLELPKTSRIKPFDRYPEMEVTLPHTQYFTLNKPESPRGKQKLTQYEINALVKNQNKIYEFLRSVFNNEKDFDEDNFAKIILSRIELLKEKLKIMESLAEKNVEETRFSEEEQSFLKNPFPIILVMSSEEHVHLCEFSTQEYRAFDALKIGRDIKIIATDTPEHQYLIKQFLIKNGDEITEVVLFDQLKESQKSGKKPCAHYQTPAALPEKPVPVTEPLLPLWTVTKDLSVTRTNTSSLIMEEYEQLVAAPQKSESETQTEPTLSNSESVISSLRYSYTDSEIINLLGIDYLSRIKPADSGITEIFSIQSYGEFGLLLRDLTPQYQTELIKSLTPKEVAALLFDANHIFVMLSKLKLEDRNSAHETLYQKVNSNGNISSTHNDQIRDLLQAPTPPTESLHLVPGN